MIRPLFVAAIIDNTSEIMNLRNTDRQWGAVTIAIHWLTLLAVICMAVLGLWMVSLTYYDPWYHEAPFIHKSIGVLLFLFTAFRLLWRWLSPAPLPLVEHSLLEQRIAGIVQALLYLLLFCIMFSGYLISTADGRPVEVFDWFAIPATLHGLDKQEDIAGVIHLVLVISLIVLVLIHAAAALKHHIMDKDRTLFRMLGKKDNLYQGENDEKVSVSDLLAISVRRRPG